MESGVKMLTDYKVGERMCQAVLLRLQKVGNSSNGGIFAKGTLEDNSGRMQFIAFDREIVTRLKEYDAPRAVIVSGPVDIVKFSQDQALQVIVQKLDKVRPEDDLSNLLPVGDFDIEIYKEKLAALIGKIRTPSLKSLLMKLFSGSFYEAFCKNPAGMKMHHAYLGGLLQHSVDVAELAVAMGQTIGKVDMDLVIAGALLHDVGKVREISPLVGFPYTNEGRLLGHITMSNLMLRDTAAELKIPYSQLLPLEHIILSHHGEQDKGSPVACATKEAFVVHYADEVNAIMNQFDTKENKSNWDYNKMLQRYLYLKTVGGKVVTAEE